MRPSVRARFLQTLASAGCALLLPASALAAGGSPVHIDPASPVAKEYALPLATARGAPPESGKSGKLFGSGIKHVSTTTSHTTSAPPTTTPTTTTMTTTPSVPPATTPAAQPSTDTSATSTPTQLRAATPRRRHHRPEHVTTVTLPALTTPTTHTTAAPATALATPAAYRVLRPGSGSGLLWMVLAAVVVVAVGSAGGIALSRRR
ncbi:MAG: hypothetical protein KGL15_08815 [Acidobacteriota bacterium]|nr:hypothetical protein [Acidobacteriota bacterium]